MKTVARELVWFFVAVLLAVPVGYLFGSLLELKPEGKSATPDRRCIRNGAVYYRCSNRFYSDLCDAHPHVGDKQTSR